MIDLAPAHLATVRAILLRNAPGVPVYAFGSRVSRRARKFSDLDLALVPEQALDWRVLARLREAFEESDLPITVDVIDWTQVGPEFKKQVGRCTAGLTHSVPRLNFSIGLNQHIRWNQQLAVQGAYVLQRKPAPFTQNIVNPLARTQECLRGVGLHEVAADTHDQLRVLAKAGEHFAGGNCVFRSQRGVRAWLTQA